MRRADAAQLAGVDESQVEWATLDEIRASQMGRMPHNVLLVLAQEPTYFWKVGEVYFMDDPNFGPVVAIDNLGFSPDLGLYSRGGPGSRAQIKFTYRCDECDHKIEAARGEATPAECPACGVGYMIPML